MAYYSSNIKYREHYRILKAAWLKLQVTYNGKPIRIAADFSTETLMAGREWDDVIQMQKQNSFNHRLCYQVKLLCIIKK
jgi:hypothetical protein